ncbi:MAG: hypothetical protein FWG91_13765 [Lachnospiraceae bacterium]|nr:hypothetical protein [Lachnospiraceae bacterium]
MTAETLAGRAKKIGLPIARDFFAGTKDDPVPEMPYLVFALPPAKARGADSVIYLIEESFDLELYTAGNDGEADEIRKKIEGIVFFDTEHTKIVVYIDSEECYQTTYEARGMLRKVKGANIT